MTRRAELDAAAVRQASHVVVFGVGTPHVLVVLEAVGPIFHRERIFTIRHLARQPLHSLADGASAMTFKQALVEEEGYVDSYTLSRKKGST